MRHPSLDEWETKLKQVLDELDDELENKFGKIRSLHPARSTRGKTSNKAQDGLFDISASFSLGTGSRFGKGYVVDIHIATLENVPKDVVKKIETITLNKLKIDLPKYFPGKNLNVDMDGKVIKIHGDLSLGNI